MLLNLFSLIAEGVRILELTDDAIEGQVVVVLKLRQALELVHEGLVVQRLDMAHQFLCELLLRLPLFLQGRELPHECAKLLLTSKHVLDEPGLSADRPTGVARLLAAVPVLVSVVEDGLPGLDHAAGEPHLDVVWKIFRLDPGDYVVIESRLKITIALAQVRNLIHK